MVCRAMFLMISHCAGVWLRVLTGNCDSCSFTILSLTKHSNVYQVLQLNLHLSNWEMFCTCTVNSEAISKQEVKRLMDADGDTPKIMTPLLMDLMEALAGKTVVQLDQEVPVRAMLRIAYALKKSVLEEHPESQKGTDQEGKKIDHSCGFLSIEEIIEICKP